MRKLRKYSAIAVLVLFVSPPPERHQEDKERWVLPVTIFVVLILLVSCVADYKDVTQPSNTKKGICEFRWDQSPNMGCFQGHFCVPIFFCSGPVLTFILSVASIYTIICEYYIFHFVFLILQY